MTNFLSAANMCVFWLRSWWWTSIPCTIVVSWILLDILQVVDLWNPLSSIRVLSKSPCTRRVGVISLCNSWHLFCLLSCIMCGSSRYPIHLGYFVSPRAVHFSCLHSFSLSINWYHQGIAQYLYSHKYSRFDIWKKMTNIKISKQRARNNKNSP